MKISTVIITLNEEKNIERCINCAETFSDEIIVVDSFSTDKTKDICLAHNVKFIEHPFIDYTSQKNFAISSAQNEWVFILDADEMPDDVLKNEILALKKNDSFVYNAYSFNRLTNYCSERWVYHCGFYPDVATRLIKKENALYKGQYVHETLEMNSLKIKHLKGNLLHYSFVSTEDHIDRINKYSTLGAKKYILKGKDISILGVIIRSKWKFFKMYFLNLGFLDGWVGYRICKIMAMETFLKYLKVREFQGKGKYTK